MVDLISSLNKHCPGLPVSLFEAHVRRMPESYLEGHAPAEIARHVRMISRLSPERPVEIEVRSLGGQSYEICIAGIDRTGVLAAITTALASDGLDTQDLRLATYAHDDDDAPSSTYFIDVARVSSSRRGWSVSGIANELRERLSLAFTHLAEGDLTSAHTAAADSGSTLGGKSRTPHSGSDPWVVKEGLTLGDFRLESKLATGGMSEVYLATQLSLSRKVAVKLATDPATTKANTTLARFQKEATVLGSFTCPHIVQVLASGTADTAGGAVLRWRAMEYLPGGDLATWLKRQGPPSASLATRWLCQALQGLLYAHQRRILHRDLKPADGNVKLSDFGLLKDAQRESMEMTVDGAVMGTPQYISPEQALADAADERSDIYSLGVTFFHVLSGRLTFEERTTTAMMLRVTQHEVPSLLDVAPQAPRPLALIVNRMVALRPEDRYQDVRVILEDLNSYFQRGGLTLAADDLPGEHPAAVEPDADKTQIDVPKAGGRLSGLPSSLTPTNWPSV